MSEKKPTPQLMKVTNRDTIEISNVSNLIRSDHDNILFETDCGKLNIKGEMLNITQLNLEKGNAEIKGIIEKIEYLGQQEELQPSEQKSIFFKKLLRTRF